MACSATPNLMLTPEEVSAIQHVLDSEASLFPEQRSLHRIDEGGVQCWVKLRPAAREFLEKLSSLGQLWVFTLAPRWGYMISLLEDVSDAVVVLSTTGSKRLLLRTVYSLGMANIGHKVLLLIAGSVRPIPLLA